MTAPTTRFVDTPMLRIAYEVREGRPAASQNDLPVLLLHGWPDDVRTWDQVVHELIGKGFKTIAPWLRGYGGTTFRDQQTMRSAQIVSLAQDAIDLLDAMSIERAIVIGHDWGARAGYVLAALFPERIDRVVVCSTGYETGVRSGDKISPEQAHAYWYQWFWNTQQGQEALESNRRGICKLLWQTWSPSMNFSEEEFEASAAAWDNPDWVACTLHGYRVRWGGAKQDPRYEYLGRKIQSRPKIHVPTVVLHGVDDGASLVKSSEGQEGDFAAFYDRRVLLGTGHFIPREQPRAVVDAVCDVIEKIAGNR